MGVCYCSYSDSICNFRHANTLSRYILSRYSFLLGLRSICDSFFNWWYLATALRFLDGCRLRIGKKNCSVHFTLVYGIFHLVYLVLHTVHQPRHSFKFLDRHHLSVLRRRHVSRNFYAVQLALSHELRVPLNPANLRNDKRNGHFRSLSQRRQRWRGRRLARFRASHQELNACSEWRADPEVLRDG